MAKHWLKQTHPKYERERWQTIKRHLHGGIIDNLASHLVKKRQGESDQEYNARSDIASYVPHFQRAVLALAGMITQSEDDAERDWFGGELGSPERPDTPMGRLWTNIDGRGTDWSVLKTQALVDMIGFQWIPTLVEGVTRTGRSRSDVMDDGSVEIISPLAVMDWTRDPSGRLTQVKVKTHVMDRTSVKEDADPKPRWHVYKLEGVEVYRLPRDTDEEGPQLVRSQPYGPDGFQYRGRGGEPILPIYFTKVPVRASVGFMMAKFAEWLFNFRNTRNFHLWSSALARAWSDVTDESGRFDKDLWEKQQELLEEGSMHFPTEISYSAPPMDGADTRNETLEQEKEDFYSTFFQSYGQAATERTATEIRQDIAQSVGAYLTLQTEALDEWENDMMWRLAQVNAPNAGPEVWGAASVTRSTDFSELSVVDMLQDIRKGAFEEGKVPLGQQGKTEAAKTWAKAHDIDVNEQEIEDAVRIEQGTTDLLQRFREQSGEDGQLQL